MIAVAMKALLEIIAANPVAFKATEAEAEQAMNEQGGTALAILLLAFLMWSTIKVAKEITSSIVDTDVDDKFQQKLLGLGLLLAGWLTGGLGAAFGKMQWVQQARAAYQKTAWARGAMKARKTYSDAVDKLDEWAGRNEQ